MRKEMKEALLRVYQNLDEAGERQAIRGSHDQGARSKVTGGNHLDNVASVIRDDLVVAGYLRESVHYKDKSSVRLPGWFRPTKDWDMLAFDGDDLLAAIELKSINSSFGNNANNRSEEALGSATDSAHAIKNDLIPYRTTPPILGYVLVIRVCDESTRPGADPQKSVYPIDPIFRNASYLNRLTILCRRLLAERIYQAVWVVGVDPEHGTVIEPEKDLTYEKFIAAIKSQLLIHRA